MTRFLHLLRRSAFRTTLAAFLLGTLLVPAAAAQTGNELWSSPNRTFYLHIQQYCEPASVIRFLDEFNWPNDLDGCGGDMLNPTTNSWTDLFFAPKFHANVTAATSAEMHIFVLSRAVDMTSVEATIDLGYATCTGSAPAAPVVQEKAGGFHEFVMPCTFEVKGIADPLARPNLTVTVSATHTYGYGVENPHASYVSITGAEPAPPKEEVKIYTEDDRPVVPFEGDDIVLVAFNDTAGNPAGGKSPGMALPGSLAAVVGGLLVALRRSRQD